VPGVFKIRLEDFKCCSDRTTDLPNGGYNCIAWAAGKKDNWWWPSDIAGAAHWPKGLPKEPTDQETVVNFIKAFETEGYSVCENADFEDGFEKIAIYVNPAGRPLHAARSLPSGVWTSKLGKGEDIEHKTLEVIEGINYGKATFFLKRSIHRVPNQPT